MQRILFISAPFGPFFRHSVKTLTERGFTVWRVVWEGGDLIQTPRRNQIIFTGGDTEETFLRRVLAEKHITAVITYNDTGRRNQLAIRLAKELKLRRYILENGYLRPHWITFDREGVNGYSKLPRDPEFYEGSASSYTEAVTFPVRMRDHVKHTMQHFAAAFALSPLLPFNSRYYGDPVWRQARYYAKEYCWRISHREEHKIAEIIARKQNDAAKIFVVLMQKPWDAQLRVHSCYQRNRPFLKEVCEAFAAHAPANAILVVKQHPYDYGVERLQKFFRALVEKCGIADRVYYLRKTSIDIVFDNADGLVTVNSTGGLAAVVRGLPVMCTGNAIFNMEGLTFQGSLDRFWVEASPPVARIVAAFVKYLKTHSQYNGGFHHPVGIELAAKALARLIVENSLAPHNAIAAITPAKSKLDLNVKVPASAIQG